ncbi:ABC transporter permease [Stenotrophomonas sp. CW117]|uniref:ABC transporter permease n=1 Tax=Stenotrophomonas TaxID=40323 RepID=UPI000702E7BD|nr:MULTISPECIES: ABC transporter permease [Stenotrophomonas]KRG86660.1 ABC transporter ATP-binding protein [Stenotrophomonas acidaminiphila]QOF99003.1 ABC transporter permease [Stenotrophomonas sp. CW117]
MLGYYLQLALRSFGRNKVLTTLMVVTIGIGIGAAMTTLTLYKVLSGDPIPEKSTRLFYPRLEPRTLGRDVSLDPEPMDQLTRFDAEELLRQKRGVRQAMMSAGSVTILPEGTAAQPFRASSRYTSADFFTMFNAPLHAGRGWSADDDGARARVAVIGSKLAGKLFGDADPVGREIHLSQGVLRVIGVMDEWTLNPRFYDLSNRRFGGGEQLFLPFSTSRDMRLPTQGSMNCWGNSNTDAEGARGLNAPCAWIQYWVELESPGQAADYRKYLADYSDQQRAAGRFERPANVRLDDVMGWLDYNRVVPNDVRMQMWLAFGFLLVCLLNTVGLLLAKFLRRSGEIGVRRALGAARGDIFRQCLAEAGAIGLAGGLLGLGFAALGLWLIRQQPDDYARLAQMDTATLLLTVALALGASLLAGLLPAWRAMQVPPALQLKSQ